MDNISRYSEWLMSLGTEVGDIGESTIGAKYKVMLLMTYIDIFAQIWAIHEKNTDKLQRTQFENWSDEFIFHDSNDEFVNERSEIEPLDSKSLYQIRNSLVHFAALPNNSKSKLSTFISSDSKSEFCNRYPNEVKRAEGQILLLTPKILFPLVVKAVILTLPKILENKDTLRAIDKKIEKESAILIRPRF